MNRHDFVLQLDGLEDDEAITIARDLSKRFDTTITVMRVLENQVWEEHAPVAVVTAGVVSQP